MLTEILAMTVIFASTTAFANEINYEDPNLAFSSSESPATESSACVEGSGESSLQRCLVAQGMQELADVGASVSYTQRLLGPDSPTAMSGFRHPAEAKHLKKKRSRNH